MTQLDSNFGLLFPGQGAQFPGMGRDWCAAYPEARAVFEQADEALGWKLSEACFATDGDEVHRTDVAQPGILTTSVAVIEVLRARAGLDLSRVPFTAGLSLGEYTALWAAGSLEFADAVRLVRLRGEAMQAASEAKPSGMLALAGASVEQAEALAAVGAPHGICSVANVNAPGQVVLSGEHPALDAAAAAAKEHGVRRAVKLTVAGAFHSECMRPAAERLAQALAEVRLCAPRVPFVTNVTGERVEDPQAIVGHLSNQVCAPVLWDRCVRTALSAGVQRFLEPAPGEVLAGLLRKIAKDAGAEVEVLGFPAPESLSGHLG
jgi:[acyl-carrier-protein] S-malonyltransferase